MNNPPPNSNADALFGANGINLNIVLSPSEIAMLAGAIFGSVLLAGILLALITKKINGK